MVRGGQCRAIAVMALALAPGCSNAYATSASKVAHDQVSVMQELRAQSGLAYRQCQETATYTYIQARIGLLPADAAATAQTFAAFYAAQEAAPGSDGKPVVWADFCRELDRTGTLYHQALIALRGYAEAIEALTDAKDFDGSGLVAAAQGASSVAQTFQVTGALVSSLGAIGSAASTVAKAAVAQARVHELKVLVRDASASVDAMIAALDAYLGALDEQGARARQLRRQVEAKLGRLMATDAKASADVITLLEAHDLATGGGVALDVARCRLTTDRALLARVRAAQQALAATSAGAKVGALETAADALAKAWTSFADSRSPVSPEEGCP